MLILVVVFLTLWVVLAIVGFAIEGLLWLGVIGVVLALTTVVIGVVRRRGNIVRGRGTANGRQR